MNKPKLIFLACKYSEPHPYLITRNINLATEYAQKVALLGAVPLCPANIGAHFEGIQTYEWWGDAYMTLMERCDAVLMLPNTEYSPGATKEGERALQLGMPVFYNLSQLKEWIGGQEN